MRTQKVVAEWFRTHGWGFAESTGAGRSGSDILGVPGLAIEVKARSDLQPQAWLRQAEGEPGLPLVVFRLNGVGESRVGEWGVLMRLDRFTELLQEAGYGDGSEASLPGDDQVDDLAEAEQHEGSNATTEQDQDHGLEPFTEGEGRRRLFAHGADVTTGR